MENDSSSVRSDLEWTIAQRPGTKKMDLIQNISKNELYSFLLEYAILDKGDKVSYRNSVIVIAESGDGAMSQARYYLVESNKCEPGQVFFSEPELKTLVIRGWGSGYVSK
jgi:hypothetical protein